MRTVDEQIINAIRAGRDLTINAHNAETKEYGARYEVFKLDNGWAVNYWGTTIVEYDARTGEVTLDNGGYFTATTKAKMDMILWELFRCSVYQCKHQWYVQIPTPDGDPSHIKYPFDGKLTFNPHALTENNGDEVTP